MVIRVIADNMSFFMDSFYKLRIGSNKVTDNKEGCFGVMVFQCIKDLACISIFITTIKSQIDFLFIGVCCVVGIIFFQFIDSCICSGTGSIFLESETPVFYSFG